MPSIHLPIKQGLKLMKEIRLSQQGKRSEFEKLIFPRLSDALNEKQKKDKVKNLLQTMKRDSLIRQNGNKWLLV
jgi:ATP-dependent DNA helicase RecG